MTAEIPSIPRDDFGPALIAFRKAANLRQNQVAAEIGLSVRTLIRWENEGAVPRVDVRDAFVGWLRARPEPEARRVLIAIGALLVAPAPAVAGPRVLCPEETARVKVTLEHAVYAAAEKVDVPAKAARQIAIALLEAMLATGITVNGARSLLAT